MRSRLEIAEDTDRAGMEILLGYSEEHGKRETSPITHNCIRHQQGSEGELSKHATDEQPAGFHSCNGALVPIFFAGKE